MPGPRRFRFTLAQLLLVAMLLALVLGLGLTMRSCALEPFQAEWLAFSLDGNTIAGGLDDGTTRVWDATTDEEIARLERRSGDLPFDRGRCGVLPDRRTGVTVSHQGIVTCWDLAVGEPSFVFAIQPGHGIAISADGKRVAEPSLVVRAPGAPPSYAIRVWDIAGPTLSLNRTLPASAPVENLAVSADGRRLGVWAHDGTVETYDLSSGRQIRHMQARRGFPTFSPDLNWASTAIPEGWDDGELTIWDLNAGAEHLTIDGHRASITAMAFSPDGKTVAAADRHGKLRLWDVATGEKLAEQSGCGEVRCIAFSPDGAQLATSESRDFLLWRYGAIRLRNPATLKSEGVVWENSLRWEASILTAGFIGWFIVWRRVRRNARWNRGQPQVIPPPGESELVLAASVEKTPALPKLKTNRRSTALWLLLMIALLGFIFADWVNATFEIGWWPSYLLASVFAALVAVAAFFALVLVLVAFQFIRSPSPEGELNIARRKTGAEGTLVRYGPVTAWFTGVCTLEQTFQQELELVRSRYSQLVGRPVAVDRPLVVLCFQQIATYEAYMKKFSVMAGYYLRWPRNTIVLCEDACWEQLGRPGKVLRTLYGHYLAPSRRLSILPGWLSAGVVIHLSYDADDRYRRNRRVRKRLAANRMLTEDEFFGQSDAAWARKLLRLEDRSVYEALWIYRDQASSFVEFLAGEEESIRRPKFRRLLEAAVGRKDIASLVQAIYGRTPGELLADWRAWAEAQPAGPIEPMPPAILEALQSRVLPLVRDPQAPRVRRVLALRAIAQWGEIGCRETLASLVREGPANLVDEAQWALETFASPDEAS